METINSIFVTFVCDEFDILCRSVWSQRERIEFLSDIRNILYAKNWRTMRILVLGQDCLLLWCPFKCVQLGIFWASSVDSISLRILSESLNCWRREESWLIDVFFLYFRKWNKLQWKTGFASRVHLMIKSKNIQIAFRYK